MVGVLEGCDWRVHPISLTHWSHCASFGCPRDLLHPELTKRTSFLHFCYRPCAFQQFDKRGVKSSHTLANIPSSTPLLPLSTHNTLVGHSLSDELSTRRVFRLGKVLHGRLQKSKIRRREGLKGLQSYIRPVDAGCSSCWP